MTIRTHIDSPHNIRLMKGDTGERGEIGPAGEPGPVGRRGDRGQTGEQGPKGDKGAAGIDGMNGKDGKSVSRGAGGGYSFQAKPAIKVITDDYTLKTTDGTIKCTGSNSFTVSLFAAGLSVRNDYHIKVAGTGDITIKPLDDQTIDDASEVTVLAGQVGNYPSVHIEPDGGGWMIQ